MLKSSISTADITKSALFCAITAVLAQIAIPIEPVPFTLGLMGVFLTAGLLDTRCATMALISYLLLGAAGVPVFAGFNGGITRLVGPTGGYLLGYLPMVMLMGRLFERFPRRGYFGTVAIMLCGLGLCYFTGSMWLALSLGYSLSRAFAVAVVPFVLFDTIKIMLAALLSVRLKSLK